MNCGDGPVKILQMTSCDSGWRAVFAPAPGSDAAYTEPVACWLLVEHDGETHVHPACALGADVCDATLAANYLGVIAPGDETGANDLWLAAIGAPDDQARVDDAR